MSFTDIHKLLQIIFGSLIKKEVFVGNQSGGRVFLFLNTDNFWRDYNAMISKGIKFVREPKKQDYELVAVFEDLYGNLWDLLELNQGDIIQVNP